MIRRLRKLLCRWLKCYDMGEPMPGGGRMIRIDMRGAVWKPYTVKIWKRAGKHDE